MAPRLGEKHNITIEITSKPRKEYSTDAYRKTGLPAAPAIMIGDDVIIQGRDITEQQLEDEVLRRLGS